MQLNGGRRQRISMPGTDVRMENDPRMRPLPPTPQQPPQQPLQQPLNQASPGETSISKQ